MESKITSHAAILGWIEGVLMNRKDLTERSWSLGATGKADTIRNIRRGKSQAPRWDTIQKLADFVGYKADEWFSEENQAKNRALAFTPRTPPPAPAGSQPHEPVNLADAQNIRELPQNLPVLGSAACGPEGLFELQGETLEYIRRPPRLLGVVGAYGLYVHGDSMTPWRENGELVMVHPKQPVRAGDHVVVQLKPEDEGNPNPPAYIKKLVKQTLEQLVLHQYNPAGEIRIPLKKVLAVHRILGWSELMGL